MKIPSLVSIALLAISGWSVAAQEKDQEPPPPPPLLHFEVDRATSDVRIDGQLDEQAWADALVIPLPWEWSPGDNVTPQAETECLVTYDDRHLYVAFKVMDPEPDKIRSHLMDRDEVLTFIQDDHVGFTIDPFQRRTPGLSIPGQSAWGASRRPL